MVRKCKCCKWRLTPRGADMCLICEADESLFRHAFTRGESIESEAESWVIGLIATGITMACLGAIIYLVRSGWAQMVWPL